MESAILKSAEQTHDRISHVRAELERDIMELNSQTKVYVDSHLSNDAKVMHAPEANKIVNLSEQSMLCWIQICFPVSMQKKISHQKVQRKRSH